MVSLDVVEKTTDVMAPGVAGVAMVPWPAVQVRTWKIAPVPATLSTKAILVPSSERNGEVTIFPPVTVVMLYANSTVGAARRQSDWDAGVPEYRLLKPTRLEVLAAVRPNTAKSLLQSGGAAILKVYLAGYIFA